MSPSNTAGEEKIRVRSFASDAQFCSSGLPQITRFQSNEPSLASRLYTVFPPAKYTRSLITAADEVIRPPSLKKRGGVSAGCGQRGGMGTIGLWQSTPNFQIRSPECASSA